MFQHSPDAMYQLILQKIWKQHSAATRRVSRKM